MITEENIGGVAGNPEEVILEAKAQLIAAKARVQALEDALRDIASMAPITQDELTPRNEWGRGYNQALGNAQEVARKALEGK